MSYSRSACVISRSSGVGTGSVWLAHMSNGDFGSDAPLNRLNICKAFFHETHLDMVLIPTRSEHFDFRHGALEEP